MNSRNPLEIWQIFAHRLAAGRNCFAKHASAAPNGGDAAKGCVGHDSEFLRYASLTFRPVLPPGGPGFMPLGSGSGKGKLHSAVQTQCGPFSLRQSLLESWSIITRSRGFAVCVSTLSFWRLAPLFRLQVASATTQVRQPTMSPCAPLAVPPQAQSLPMPRAAAKPKARLSARWLVAFPAVCRAFRPATDTGSDFGLTAAQKRGVTVLPRPFGDIPRMAFLHFRAVRALPRKGCHV